MASRYGVPEDAQLGPEMTAVWAEVTVSAQAVLVGVMEVFFVGGSYVFYEGV